jgi:CheY-like chemotaxis protein
MFVALGIVRLAVLTKAPLPNEAHFVNEMSKIQCAVHGAFGKNTHNLTAPLLYTNFLLKLFKWCLNKGDMGKILCADDEDLMLRATVRCLSVLVKEDLAEGIDTAVNGREALEIFESNPKAYSVVVTDNSMPEMTGLELLELLRYEKIGKVLHSGDSSSIVQYLAEQLGAVYVAKPYSNDDLRRVVKEILLPH